MHRLQKIVIAVSIAATAHFNIASAAVPLSFAPGYEACSRNCAQITQVDNTVLVTLLDKAGKSFKVVTAAIDPTATKAVVSVSHDDPTLPNLFGATTTSGEFTVDARHITVQTSTATIIHTMISYYQRGQLIDVKVAEQRFAKQKEK